ncbi:ABC transporter substrate-binding protein [Yinghuangia soli]|uniref:ABC transporter substrate-binding protein n=1 Tax=Yinghuangia soli TaxID=2908204 RepID=A0AA41PVP2_9ACTN|nr:ABC transporter substrate-binding protein [Yinghuangia soli]MCF2525759.1 ABC transporter substrate-binding protein [Yinghuangia soli]
MARRWAVGMVVPLLFVAACSRSGDMRVAEGGGGGGGVLPGNNPKPTNTQLAAGDFGDLKGLCSAKPADQKPASQQVRGVSETEIKVATMADANNPAQPGLGQEFWDMGEAFADWCNGQGGINGRKIKVDKRDGKLFEAAAATAAACQEDFMSVGGGNPLDDASVEPRLGCNLGQIPGYLVTTKAINAPLQVQPGGIPANRGPVGPYKALFEKYPDLKGKVGILGQELDSLKPVADRYEDAIQKAGGTIVSKQLSPPIGATWRAFVESMKAADVQILVSAGVFAVNATPLFQEMQNAGWAPKVILSDQSAYHAANVQAAADGLVDSDFFVYTTFWPQEAAKDKPVADLAVQLFHTKKKDARLVYFHYSGLNAWLLWAQAVKACGADVTVECVLEKSKVKDWTAGGLFAPNTVGPLTEMDANPCFSLLKLGKDGFQVDKEVTKPSTDAIFNCSSDNTVTLDQTYS